MMRAGDSFAAKTWKSMITTFPFRSVSRRVCPWLSGRAMSMMFVTFTFEASTTISSCWRAMRRSFIPSMAMLCRFCPRTASG